MESLDSEPCFVDELLNFSSDMDEEDDNKPKKALASSLRPNGLLGPTGDSVRPLHVSLALCFFVFFPFGRDGVLFGGDSAESSQGFCLFWLGNESTRLCLEGIFRPPESTRAILRRRGTRYLMKDWVVSE